MGDKHRCLYLARCYAPLKRYAESLTLLQHANIHIRETLATLSLFDSDPISSASPPYYPLDKYHIVEVEDTLADASLRFKRDWFAYNGGSVHADGQSYKKPLFFNIALNYVELDMDRLQERAGKQPAPAPVTVAAPVPSMPKLVARSEPVPEKKQTRARVEEARPATPEPQAAPARGGLGSLLGGWWGKS